MSQSEATIREWHAKCVWLSESTNDSLLGTITKGFDTMAHCLSRVADKRSIRLALRGLDALRLLSLEDEDPDAVTIRSATFGLIESLVLTLQAQTDKIESLLAERSTNLVDQEMQTDPNVIEREMQTDIKWVPDVYIDLQIPQGHYNNDDFTPIGLPRLSEENDTQVDGDNNQISNPLDLSDGYEGDISSGDEIVTQGSGDPLLNALPPDHTLPPAGENEDDTPEEQDDNEIDESEDPLNAAANEDEDMQEEDDQEVETTLNEPLTCSRILFEGARREKSPEDRRLTRAAKREAYAAEQLREEEQEEEEDPEDPEPELPNLFHTGKEEEEEEEEEPTRKLRKRSLQQAKKSAETGEPKRKRGRPFKSAPLPVKTESEKSSRKEAASSSKKTFMTTPKCVKCDMHPQSTYAYTQHLEHVHNTTPAKEQIYLTCSCGMKVINNKYNPNHTMCEGLLFTVLKMDIRKRVLSRESYLKREKFVVKECTAEMKCVDATCDYRTTNSSRYITHLRHKHNTNMFRAGFVFVCDCGKECLSEKHKCDHYNLTVVRKRDGPILTLADKITPRCKYCYTYPKSVCAYASHLKDYHQKRIENLGIYLRCSCGIEIRSCSERKNHTGCTSREFTLHAMDGSEYVLADPITH